MKIRKIISALLTICLLSGCLCAAVSAEESTCPIIELDQTVTFDVTPDDHVRYYAYTAAQDGQVVLYGVGDSPEMDTLSVHSVSPFAMTQSCSLSSSTSSTRNCARL